MSDNLKPAGPALTADDLFDVQCDRCKALHPLRQRLGHALACMDRLNNTRRPCPACGATGRWVLCGPAPTEE